MSLFSKSIIGLLALFINALWHFTSIIKMKDALYTKSKEDINLVVVYLSFFFCLDFIIYSLMVKNYYLLIPNFVGVFLWGVNLIIYYWVDGIIEDNSFIMVTCFNIFGVSPKSPKTDKQPGYILGNVDLSRLTENDFLD